MLESFGRHTTVSLHHRDLGDMVEGCCRWAGGEAAEAAPRKAGEGTRTPNLLITNQLLYQLSYASAFRR